MTDFEIIEAGVAALYSGDADTRQFARYRRS